ncbi:hypothetical protein STEG23_015116 [Scotinomys teguina]
MLALISRLLDWFRSLFWKEEMELTLVGLQYSGKTTFVNVIAIALLIPSDPRSVKPCLNSSFRQRYQIQGPLEARFTCKCSLQRVTVVVQALWFLVHRHHCILTGTPPWYPFASLSRGHLAGQFSEDMIPTVGFNMRKVTKVSGL